MNIEEKIRNNRVAFDCVKMPEGSRERFNERLANSTSFRAKRSEVGKSHNDGKTKRLWIAWTSAAAAVIAVIIVVTSVKPYRQTSTKSTQITDNKLVTMRKYYDAKVEEAVISLEDVLENVDDSTKKQINEVIRNLLDIDNVFADIAPLPEDRQIAIAEQIYDNKLKTIELITEKINK